MYKLVGLTRSEVGYLSLKLLERSDIGTDFIRRLRMTRRMWFRGFRWRHTNIAVRRLEATSSSRAQAFNKQQAKKFFRTSVEVMLNYQIMPGRGMSMPLPFRLCRKRRSCFLCEKEKAGWLDTSVERRHLVMVSVRYRSSRELTFSQET